MVAADGLDGEGGGVVVGADVHRAGVGGEVVDPVGHGLADGVIREVVDQRGRRAALGPPLPPGVAELPDELLLLGVHADHRVRSALVRLHLLAYVAELAVPVRVLLSLDRLDVALQAEALAFEHVADGIGGYLAALRGQLGRERAGRLGRPPQRRHRVAPLVRLDQGQQRREQARVQVSGPLAATARTPGPPQRPSAGIQLVHAQRHRGLADPCGPRHQPDPAVPERPGLGSHQQPPLPLVQVREDDRELRRQNPPRLLQAAHSTAACRKHGSYGLFCSKP